MTRALALLLWLRCGAWFRRAVSNARSFRGALTLAFGLFFFLLVLGPNLATRLVPEYAPDPTDYTERTRRLGPLMLLGYCVLTVLFSSTEQGIVFSPAEVHLLFPGPFSRGQLLAYKIGSNALLCVAYALFLTPFVVPLAGSALVAFPGLVLTLWFIMLFSTMIALLVQVIDVHALTRPRRFLLWSLALLAAGGVIYSGQDMLTVGPMAVLSRIEESAVARGLGAPFQVFVDAFTAQAVWPDLLSAGAWGLTINGGLLLGIFLLDTHYLEGAAAASEQAYAAIQRMRSSGALAAGTGTGRLRITVPMLMWGYGVGPIAWRQLLTALRNLRPVLVFLALFTLLIIIPRLTATDYSERTGLALASGVLALTVALLTPLLTFDFRGDVDRIDLLKGLPLSASALVVGQLLTPVLLLSAIQVLLVGIVSIVWGGIGLVVGGVVFFAIPFNFLSFAIENVLFLWFPARLIPGAPGDFQQLGRQTLMMFAKCTLLGLVLIPAGVGAGIVLGVARGFGANGTVPAMAMGWAILSALSVGLVPLVARAFRAFDVSRDTPP